MLVAAWVGPAALSPSEVWAALRHGPNGQEANDAILWSLRLPRIMLAALVDRGERELPIAADFVAHTIALHPGERLVLQRADDATLSFTVDHA